MSGYIKSLTWFLYRANAVFVSKLTLMADRILPLNRTNHKEKQSVRTEATR